MFLEEWPEEGSDSGVVISPEFCIHPFFSLYATNSGSSLLLTQMTPGAQRKVIIVLF